MRCRSGPKTTTTREPRYCRPRRRFCSSIHARSSSESLLSCVRERVPLVSGAAVRFDGQVAVFDHRQEGSSCYHCLFPADAQGEEERCATMGVFAPLVGVIGTMQAMEAIKLLAGIGTSLAGRLLLFDARAARWHEVRLSRDPHCPVCGRERVAA